MLKSACVCRNILHCNNCLTFYHISQHCNIAHNKNHYILYEQHINVLSIIKWAELFIQLFIIHPVNKTTGPLSLSRTCSDLSKTFREGEETLGRGNTTQNGCQLGSLFQNEHIRHVRGKSCNPVFILAARKRQVTMYFPHMSTSSTSEEHFLSPGQITPNAGNLNDGLKWLLGPIQWCAVQSFFSFPLTNLVPPYNHLPFAVWSIKMGHTKLLTMISSFFHIRPFIKCV